MIRRIRDYGKKKPTKDSHKIYVICEGKGTEPDYFAFFEGLSSNLQVITIPPTTGTDPLKLMELSKETLTGEDRLYSINYQYGFTIISMTASQQTKMLRKPSLSKNLSTSRFLVALTSRFILYTLKMQSNIQRSISQKMMPDFLKSTQLKCIFLDVKS